MPDGTNPKKPSDAEREDRVLFKTYGGPIAVDLIPQILRGSQGDVLVRGFFNTSVAIDVVFAGRRARMVMPMLTQLKAVDKQLRQTAAAAGHPDPKIDSIRFPVQVKGSWRHNVAQDRQGDPTRSYQLVAARWAYAGSDGELVQFGEAPAVMPEAKARKKSYILNAHEFDAVQQSFQEE